MVSIHKVTIRHRIINNFVGVLASEVIGKSFIFITNIILARRLGVEGFGLFTLAQTVVCFLWIGADMGTYIYGIREVARNKDDNDGLLGTLISLKIFSGIVFYSMYVLVVLLFPTKLSMLEKLTFIASGIYILTYPLYFDWIFKGIEKFSYLIVATFAYSTFFLITVYFFVKTNADITVACILWSLSYLVGGLSLFLILHYGLGKRLSLTVDLQLWIKHIKKSIYFGLAGLLSMLHGSFPILFAGVMLGQRDVGVLSAAYKIVVLFSAPAYYISIAFFPIISDLYWNNHKKYKQLDTVLLLSSCIIGIFAALLCFIFSQPAINLTYGTQYKESVYILKIVVWVLPLQFVRYKFSNFLASTENQRLQLIPNIVAVVFYLGFFLFARFTLTTLAVSIVLCEAVLVATYSIVSRSSYAFNRS
jgi:O-antigen/teichoic acid export membrane protein